MNEPAPVRVLRVITRLNVGGPARHVVSLQAGLSRETFESLLVTGIVPAGEADMSALAAANGVTPLVIPHLSRDLSFGDVLTIWQLWRLMRTFKPDLVHTHTSKAGAVGRIAGLLYRYATPGVLAARPRPCRFIHTYHGHIFYGYYGPLRTRLFLAIDRFLARFNTDRVIVLSEHQRAEIFERFRIGRSSQCAIVPLGIDLSIVGRDRDSSAAATDERARNGTTVGIVARLAAIKNHDLFLRVAARARAGTRFVIYGDGPCRADLQERASALGLDTRVIFAGVRPPAEIYRAVDAVMLTSKNEGTPQVLIEAMAARKPVISTAVGGVVDLLGPIEERITTGDGAFDVHERGISAASQDERGLAAALDRLLTDEALRIRLVTRAEVYARATHTRERLIENITALYSEVLFGTGPERRREQSAAVAR